MAATEPNLIRLRLTGLFLLCGLVLHPAPAQAQFGLSVVYDPRSLAQSVLLYKRAYQQLVAAQKQLAAQVTALQKLRNPQWRTLSGVVTQAGTLMRNTTALGYGLATLDADFTRTFPGNQRMTNAAQQLPTQATRTLETLRAVLNATHANAQTIPAGITQLQQMKQQLTTIQGHEQALELASTISVYTAEELTLLRQQLMAATNAQAVFAAQQVNAQAQGRANEHAFLHWLATPPTPARTIVYP